MNRLPRLLAAAIAAAMLCPTKAPAHPPGAEGAAR